MLTVFTEHHALRDAKTELQEWTHRKGLATPDYRELSRSGPDHAPIFSVSARLANGETGSGTARSKKLAEQEAAADLLVAVTADE